jgi:CPA1 family monovalent cation:H+ antiporter
VLGVHDDGEAEREELRARDAAASAAIERAEALRVEDWPNEDTLDRAVRLMEFRRRRLRVRAGKELEDGVEDPQERSIAYQRVMHEILDAQRDALVDLHRAGEISSSVLHALERELDLEDERLEI